MNFITIQTRSFTLRGGGGGREIHCIQSLNHGCTRHLLKIIGLVYFINSLCIQYTKIIWAKLVHIHIQIMHAMHCNYFIACFRILFAKFIGLYVTRMTILDGVLCK